jgi:uncharacterized membrane protein YgdD (TMEM256/DUF423 family)
MALGIAAGAFGAHALKASLPPDMLEVWQTGASYQLWNALGLLALAALPGRLRLPALLIAVGVVLFSGSLYLLALSGVRMFGAVTPVGGVLMIAGWALAAVRLALR